MTNFEENGMFGEDKTPRTFCGIKNGKIAIKTEANDPKATTLKYLNDDKEECFSYYRMFPNVTGTLVDIKTREGKFNTEICITLASKTGSLVELQIPLYSAYARYFMKCLPNVLNLSKEVTINPFKARQKDKNGKDTDYFSFFCLIKQSDENGKLITCKSKYTKEDPNGLPDWEKTKVQGKDKWNQDKQTEFLAEMVMNDILPVITKNIVEEVKEQKVEMEETPEDFEQPDEDIDFTTNADDIGKGEEPDL